MDKNAQVPNNNQNKDKASNNNSRTFLWPLGVIHPTYIKYIHPNKDKWYLKETSWFPDFFQKELYGSLYEKMSSFQMTAS